MEKVIICGSISIADEILRMRDDLAAKEFKVQ
jgi:hypothetical protein